MKSKNPSGKKVVKTFQFEVGEVALDEFNRHVTIVQKALRPENYLNRKQYLISRETRTWYGKKAVGQYWELEASLTKLY